LIIRPRLAATVYAAGAFVLGGRTGDAAVLASARRAMYAAFGLVAAACLAMIVSLLTHDFSVLYVANNSNSELPTFYRFAAVWGAHEGSLLLPAATWSLAVARSPRLPALMPWSERPSHGRPSSR
jgi:cytochrome c-type biogenesis protein CcmF